MIRNICIAVFFLAATACADEERPEAVPVADTQNVAGTAVQEADSSGAYCFASMTTSDTVALRYVLQDSVVKGQLLYDFNEKDRNVGSITGSMHGDTLIADYTFMAEGVNSVRQVVFLRQGSEMTEGFGSVKEENGKMVYVDITKLSFDKAVILKSQNCDNLPPMK